jgi:hypothetical protein
LLSLISENLAQDVSQIKDSLIRRDRAEADGAEAEAMKKLAEAAEAVNRANIHKRKDRLALLHQQSVRLQNAKTQAEIEVLLADADTRRAHAIGETKAKLIEALSKVTQEGGAVFFSQENLERILNTPLKSILSQTVQGSGGAYVALPDVLDASVRLRMALRELGFTSIAELSKISEEDFLKCRYGGQTTLSEARQILAEMGQGFLASGT